MATERYVALGLARARASWFTAVARWSTMAALPLEFVKCLSIEEARARLASGRSYSALLLDGGHPNVDRDLLSAASQLGIAVIIVPDGRVQRDWLALGASAVLPREFDHQDLLRSLQTHGRPVLDPTARPEPRSTPATGGWRGSLIAVTGGGGAGTSTLAAATAQGLSDDPRFQGMVLLADCALVADQAMLHDAREVVPGIQELVEACRAGRPSREEVTDLTFAVPERGYRLLLGIRNHRDWVTIRPRALETALDVLRGSFRLVIADVEPDVEGEIECGSVDIEERNLLSRSALSGAEVVLVVGLPGLKGLHRLVRTIGELVQFGVDGERILPVINRAPRSPRARAAIASGVASLLGTSAGPGSGPSAVPLTGPAAPIFVPDRRQIEDAHATGERFASAVCSPLSRAVLAALERAPSAVPGTEPERVRPGTLGSWAVGAEVV